MSELRAVVEAALALRARGETFLSATVVRVRGSAYRRPGARMLATRESWVAGSISGGCLEREVLTRGFWRTRDEPAVLVTYNEAEDALDERSGSGCQGVIDMLVERCEPGAADWFQLAEDCLREERVGVAVTVFRSARPGVPVGARVTLREGGHASTVADASLERELLREAQTALAGSSGPRVLRCGGPDGEVEALVECVVPPTHLFVFGAGHDATPVVELAKQLGWSVSVWDALPRVSTRERLRSAHYYLTGSVDDAVSRLNACQRAAAVVMGHHLEQDRNALRALLDSRARYIGVLGPRRRSEQMLADCGASEPARARVHAPVGLSLGAETPAEIALAIVAEAQAVLNDAGARALRDEPGAIHASAPARPKTRAASAE